MPVLGPPVANSNIVNQNVAGIAPPLPAGTPTVKNFADSAAVYEYSYSTGVGPYQLTGANGAYFKFADAYQDGDTVYYRVTDESSNTEFSIGTFNAAANTISRDTIIESSNQGAAVNWTGRTKLLIHALVPSLPLCATAPAVGDVLAWDGVDYCPATLGSPAAPVAVICPTPPLDGQVLIWSAAENAYCPADLCTLVAACMIPPASGCTWVWQKITPSAITLSWIDGTLSSDASQIVILSQDQRSSGGLASKVYKSLNGGVTWSDITPPPPYVGSFSLVNIRGSTDGMILATGSGDILHGTTGDLWLSKDGGASWVAQGLAPAGSNWLVSMSNNGNTILAYNLGGGGNIIYATTNQGLSWASIATPLTHRGQDVLVTPNGSIWFVSDGQFNTFKSMDNGVTWSASLPSPGSFIGSFDLVGYSDGSTLFIGNQRQDSLYRSDNFGAWQPLAGIPPQTWNTGSALAVSSNNQVVAVGSSSSGTGITGAVWVSCDGGVTWSKQNIDPTKLVWKGMRVSADNSHILTLGNPVGGPTDIWLGTRS